MNFVKCRILRPAESAGMPKHNEKTKHQTTKKQLKPTRTQKANKPTKAKQENYQNNKQRQSQTKEALKIQKG